MLYNETLQNLELERTRHKSLRKRYIWGAIGSFALIVADGSITASRISNEVVQNAVGKHYDIVAGTNESLIIGGAVLSAAWIGSMIMTFVHTHESVGIGRTIDSNSLQTAFIESQPKTQNPVDEVDI